MSRVTEHLQNQGAAFEVIPHEQTYTSIEEARALGISAGEVVKTVLVATSSGYCLMAVPGYRRLDMKLVHQAIGDAHARLATEEEMARDFPDYELGALPPLGALLGTPVYVDPEVMAHDEVVFAGGTQTESIKMRTEDAFGDGPATVVPLTRHPEEEEKDPLT